MKKRFFSFILAICLIIPCAFALFACGGGDDKPVDLAGKTITCTKDSEVYWQFEAYHVYKEVDGKTYTKVWNLEEFVETVFYAENGKDYLKESFSIQEINTLEEAKAGVENYVCSFMVERNPLIVFSADGTTATTYAYADRELKTPLKTYTVQKEGESIYKLYDKEEQVGNILVSNANSIQCSGSAFQLDSRVPVNSLTDGREVMIQVPQMDGAEGDYIEVSLREGSDLTFMLDVFLGYKVK